MRVFSSVLQRVAVLLAAFVVTPAAASSQATVEGMVQYGAEQVAMTHVVARETRSLAGSSQAPDLVILITDRAPSAEVAASRQAFFAAGREGRLRGLLLVLEQPSDRARFVIFGPGGATDETSVPDIFSRVELLNLVREGGTVSAELRTAEPMDFDVPGSASSAGTYAINLRFRAPIAEAPQPSQILTGPAARDSEQAAAALRALQLIHTGSVADLRASLHASHPLQDASLEDEADGILAVAREVFPAPETFLQSIEQVVIYGDLAVVVARDGDGASTVSLRRDGGEWKLAAAPIPND